jgi:hypothetical protein
MAHSRSYKTHVLRTARSGEDNEATTHCGLTGVQDKIGAEFLTMSGSIFRVSGGSPTCSKCKEKLAPSTDRAGRPRLRRRRIQTEEASSQ